MNKELETQIDELILKAHKDLRLRILRVVERSVNKSLKEQAKNLKNTSKNAISNLYFIFLHSFFGILQLF
mgnify:CR=1 FL=1